MSRRPPTGPARGIHHVAEGPAGAPAVLLVHPLGVTHRLWDATAAALRERHRVVRYDVRGHGSSAVPPGPYTLAQMAEDARAARRPRRRGRPLRRHVDGQLHRDGVRAPRAPTLVVVGEKDPGTPVAMSREIVDRIVGARLLVLPGALHCSPVEAADAFYPELAAFLDGVA